MVVNYIEISTNFSAYKKQIQIFLDKLTGEFAYISLSIERIEQAKDIILALYDNKIIGLAGIEKKKYIPVCFVITDKQYSSFGIGKKIMEELLCLAERKYSFLYGAVQKKNLGAYLNNLQLGFKVFGTKGATIYMLKTFSVTGRFFFVLFINFFKLYKFFK